MGLLSDVDEYLTVLQTNQSSLLTQKNYRNYLHRFLDFISEFRTPDGRRLTQSSEINSDVIKAYSLYLSGYTDPKTQQSYHKSTQNYYLIALRQFFRYLNHQQRSGLDYRQIHLHAQPSLKTQVLTEVNLIRLLKSPDVSSEEGLRDRAILSLIISTGLRVSQVSLLNRADVLLTIETAHLKLPTSTQAIKLPEPARTAISSFLSARHDNYSPLFIRYKGEVNGENNGEKMRLSPRSIERMVKKYERLTHLKINVTPQTMRHSFALNLLRTGKDVEEVKESMDYSSIMSVKRYEKLYSEDKRDSF